MDEEFQELVKSILRNSISIFFKTIRQQIIEIFGLNETEIDEEMSEDLDEATTAILSQILNEDKLQELFNDEIKTTFKITKK